MFTGIGLSGYRSFGPVQYMVPFGRLNIFAGQNNAGKSNILRAVESLRTVVAGRTATPAPKGHDFKGDHLNQHIGSVTIKLTVSLPLPAGGAPLEAYIDRVLPEQLRTNHQARERLARIVQSCIVKETPDWAWFHYSPFPKLQLLRPTQSDFTENGAAKVLKHHEWHELWQLLTGMSGGGLEHWIAPVIERLSPVNYTDLPDVHRIDAFRRVGAPNSKYEGLNGEGLIDRLAALERPAFVNQSQKADFESINQFVRDVTEKPSARIEIPSDRSTILLEIDNKTLPLESLGTGLHEVIILAAAATTVKDAIICMEEPEIHLHPALQRKLLRYLFKKTSNQYFITTHSAHLLDSPNTTVFHVWLQDHASHVARATTPTTKSAICLDLGYHASDLLQANCVIWVEGPSDRIYLNHWLSVEDSALREGIDYSIMFYGGRLLSHLSADDPELDDFISLRRLNRNIAILIDSDRQNIHAKINQTKRRVQTEFDKGPGFAWITKGRETENYVPSDLIQKALQASMPDAQVVSKGPFDKAYTFREAKGRRKSTEVDKVKLAREIVKLKPSLNMLDLQAQIRKLVRFIRASNPR